MLSAKATVNSPVQTSADADELLNVIAVNSDGQLLVGYSEDHIENDESAEWEYVYIFSK